MNEALTVRIEWLDAPGVNTPELASTWARYEIWVDGRCVTQVEDTDGTFRRSVHGSLYPLAEWIASNWWVLNFNIRPSAVEPRYWSWPNLRVHRWLAQHNIRAAGDGMAWPNLTLVAEGAVTRAVWVPDPDRSFGPVRFVSIGDAWLRPEGVSEGLARLVNHVLDRLAETGLPKTRLAEEWTAVAKTDDEEREFCRTVARLGLDPYSVDDQTAADVVEIAGNLSDELIGDFFDSADPQALRQAAEWTRRAVVTANKAATTAKHTLQPLYEVALPWTQGPSIDFDRPWAAGYSLARQVREALGVQATAQFDILTWVGRSASTNSAGIQGVVAVDRSRCGVVLSESPVARVGLARARFGQARALGRVLARPQQHSFVLSTARGYDEAVARAFAAELLAPAEGIRRALAALGKQDDAALDAAAKLFGVSPLVIRHQYDNHLAGVTSAADW